MAAQEFSDFNLGQAVLTYERLNDPCFFELMRPPTCLIQAVDGGFCLPIVDVDQLRRQCRHAPHLTSRFPAREAIEYLRFFVAQACHYRRTLTPPPQ